MTKKEAIISDYTKTLQRLKGVMQQPVTDIVRDSAIQRFEFCVELSWKLMKTWLNESEGVVAAGPKDAVRKTF